MANKVKIDVELLVKKAQENLKKLKKETSNLADATKRDFQTLQNSLRSGFSKVSANIKRNLGDIKKQIVGVAIGNIVADSFFKGMQLLRDAFTESARRSLAFGTALKEIETILPNNTKLTNETVDSLKNLAKQFGTESQAQAKAFYQVVSSGITDSSEASKLLVQANQLATGGLAELGGSIDILTSVVNTYGAENISAKEAADSLFKTVQLGKTDISQLSANLGQVLPSAKAAGLSFDELNASVALLTTRGVKTNIAITQLKSLFNSMALQSDKLGEGFDLTAVKTDGFATVMKRLDERTGGSQEELLKLLGSSEAVSAVLNVASGSAKDLSNNIEEYGNKAGAAKIASDKIIETDLAKQIQILGNNFALAGENIFTVFTPSLLEATKALNGMLDFETDTLEEARDKVQILQEQLGRLNRRGDSENVKNQIADIEEKLRLATFELERFNLEAGNSSILVESTAGASENLKRTQEQLQLTQLGFQGINGEVVGLRENFVELANQNIDTSQVDSLTNKTKELKQELKNLTPQENQEITSGSGDDEKAAISKAEEEKNRIKEEKLRQSLERRRVAELEARELAQAQLTELELNEDLEKENRELIRKEKQGVLREEELIAFQEFQQDKINNEFFAEEQRVATIKDASLRRIKEEELEAKKRIAINKALNKSKEQNDREREAAVKSSL